MNYGRYDDVLSIPDCHPRGRHPNPNRPRTPHELADMQLRATFNRAVLGVIGLAVQDAALDHAVRADLEAAVRGFMQRDWADAIASWADRPVADLHGPGSS